MNSHLSVGQRWRIVSLRIDQGESVREIARMMHCCTRSVYSILQLFEETGDVMERTGRGRAAILTGEQIHTLRQLFYR
jgi:transposase